MKQRIKIEIPVEKDMEISVDPPCVYCGKSTPNGQQNIWNYKLPYNIQKWGFTRKFQTPTLVKVIKDDHTYLTENISFKLPYCDKHIKPKNFFTQVDTISLITPIAIAIILLILLFINKVHLELGVFFTLTTIFGIPIVLLGIFLLLGMGIKAIIAKTDPTLADMPFSYGNYGVEISQVRCDSGKPGVGPIRYYLPLAFSDPKVAKKFLQAYPHAKILKGTELVK